MGCNNSVCVQINELENQRNLEKAQKMMQENTGVQQAAKDNSNQTLIKRQDLSVSDYDAFIKKSQQEGKTEYPSAFKFVKLSPLTDKQISNMIKQDVNPLQCTRIQLVKLSCSLIMQNSFSKNKLNSSNIEALITEIAHNYNSVCYHNLSHGVSLMQMIYKCFKIQSALRKAYSDQELTYYLIAGITHDVNHKGTNNLFEVKMKSELAKVAQDDAVLEKMHLSTFLNICKSKPQFDVISKSSNPQLTKQKMTRAILATDMAKHFKNLQTIKKAREQNIQYLKDEQKKIQMMQNLVHACDIGNGLLPTQQYILWGSILTYQFNQQTKLQAKNNVPVTQFLKYKGIIQFYDGQIGFLNTFVLPLWKEINCSFPNITNLVANIDKNIQAIKALKQKQQS